MSVVNALANLAAPDYPTLYVVGSSILDEARRRDPFKLSSWAGYLLEDESPNLPEIDELHWKAESVKVEDESATVTEESEEYLQRRIPRSTSQRIKDFFRTDFFFWIEFSFWILPKADPNPSNVECRTIFIPCTQPYLKHDPLRVIRFPQKQYRLPRFTKPRGSDVFKPIFNDPDNPDGPQSSLIFWISLSISLAPLAVIGGLSKFYNASSTHAERIWTMTWLAFGVFIGCAFSDMTQKMSRIDLKFKSGTFIYFYFCSLCGFSIYCAPAVGGFVVVGKMLMAYGTCTSV